MDSPVTPILGLVGGIASGKSTVAELFVELGYRHLDADRIAHGVLEQPPVRKAIAATFGTDVLDGATGAVDRTALGARVFADDEARARLEALVHPVVRQEILAELERVRASDQPVVLDAPLLFETGLDRMCTATVFVEVNRETREARAAARGWDPGELGRRESTQLETTVKKGRSTYTIHNSGLLTETRRQIAALDHAIRGPSGQGS